MSQEKGYNLKPDSELKVDRVMYSGDEGGIMCHIEVALEEKTAVVISLTHLKVANDNPLAEEIRAYQQRRTIRLALQDGKTGRAKRLMKKSRQKKGFGN